MAYTGINLLLNRINGGLSIHHYMMLGGFIVQILTLSSIWSHLHKLLHKNTSSQKLQRLEKPIQLIFCHVTRNLLIVSSTNLYFNFELFVPFLGLTWNIELSFCFFEMGWFPIRISDTFRFSPIYGLSVQMVEMGWFPIQNFGFKVVQMVEMGWFPIRNFWTTYEISRRR